MRLVCQPEGHAIKAGCCVCGEAFELCCHDPHLLPPGSCYHAVSYRLETDDGESLGDVCYKCVTLPAHAIKARIVAWIRTWEDQESPAAWYRLLAEPIDRVSEDLMTPPKDI